MPKRGRPGAAPSGLGTHGSGLAEAGGVWREAGAGEAAAGSELALPFARQLALLAANVVGWGGSVRDRDAIDFAAAFYAELGRRSSVQRAAAVARRKLLQARSVDARRGRHWHLARVYLGPGGGGALTAPGLPTRTSAMQRVEKEFLDKERQRVPVASRAAFVGRRRAIQRVLRAFRDEAPGVLVYGMGALGKSSLAARVAARSPSLNPVLVFERYDALAVLDEVLEAVPAIERAAQKAAWREAVRPRGRCSRTRSRPCSRGRWQRGRSC